jgi:hypothetical protein
MKNIFFIILAILLFGANVNASEIIGHISTNPDLLNNIASTVPAENPPVVNSDDKANLPDKTGGSGFIFQKTAQTDESNKNVEKNNVKVLGIKYYPNNSLLRGSGPDVYIIKGKIKKLIRNLKELYKYRGQPIYESTDEDLSLYPTRDYLDGDLIRAKGDNKIYVISNEEKQYIKSLEELHRQYFGLKIFNISQEEMDLY